MLPDQRILYPGEFRKKLLRSNLEAGAGDRLARFGIFDALGASQSLQQRLEALLLLYRIHPRYYLTLSGASGHPVGTTATATLSCMKGSFV